MTAQRYWTGIIDGIALEDAGGAAGFTLKGAADFNSGGYVKNITKAADGYPHELLSPNLYGQGLELAFLHVPITLFDEVLTALVARNDTGQAFECTFEDGFQVITRQFKTGATPFYERGEPDGDYIKDAVIRLVSTGG